MSCTGGALQYKIENSNGDDLDDEYDWLTLTGSQLEIDPSMVNVVINIPDFKIIAYSGSTEVAVTLSFSITQLTNTAPTFGYVGCGSTTNINSGNQVQIDLDTTDANLGDAEDISVEETSDLADTFMTQDTLDEDIYYFFPRSWSDVGTYILVFAATDINYY